MYLVLVEVNVKKASVYYDPTIPLLTIITTLIFNLLQDYVENFEKNGYVNKHFIAAMEPEVCEKL